MGVNKYLNFDVANHAKKLAIEIGLNSKDVNKVYTGGLYHDVGKFTTPKVILNKTGKLNCSERKIMQKHALAGFNILKKHNKSSALIAATHHEKWDGSGYPFGLAGERIPFFTRIVTIVDVFDALISKRVYKEAWEKSRVIEYLYNESGKHFDPNLIEVFLSYI